jgi:hypothetical protein
MIANSFTKMRWLQMIAVKNCGKVIQGQPCPCANDLRKVLLKIPTSPDDLKSNEKKIFTYQVKYNLCTMRKFVN